MSEELKPCPLNECNDPTMAMEEVIKFCKHRRTAILVSDFCAEARKIAGARYRGWATVQPDGDKEVWRIWFTGDEGLDAVEADTPEACLDKLRAVIQGESRG